MRERILAVLDDLASHLAELFDLLSEEAPN